MSTITVTSDAASGLGSFANAVSQAKNGDTIAFASDLAGTTGNTIDLAATLVIAKNITIQGSSEVTLDGGNANTVMQVNAGETLNLSGVTIADGNGTGAAGTAGTSGGNAAGGILDLGKLTISNVIFTDDSATGGTGGAGAQYKGGGGGGQAAGAIYVAASGSLSFGQGVVFNSNTGTGGTGGTGGSGVEPYGGKSAGGSGGAGGNSGSAGHSYYASGAYGGAGGKPGQAGGAGKTYSYRGHSAHGAGGGGGGGSAFANYGGAGTIGKQPVSTVVTSDAASGQGSLATVLAAAPTGSTITFAADLTGDTGNTIDLSSVLVISKNIKIEGSGNITLDGGNVSSLVYVAAGATVALDGLGMQNGTDNSAAAGGVASIYFPVMNAGNLTIENSTLSNTESSYSPIQNTGSLTIDSSAFTGNIGVTAGVIDNRGQLAVTNSTFTGNKANAAFIRGFADAGAIYMALGSTTVYPSSDTFSNNTATVGKGGTGYRNFGGLGKVTGAPVITVTTDAASGAGSLAAAVQEAISGQEIVFASKLTGKTGNVIDLPSTLVISVGVTIDGGGDVTLSGGNKHTVLEIDTDSTVTLTGLTIANGASTAAGGQYSATAGGILDLGSLDVSNTIFRDDTATGLNGANGANGTTNGGPGGGGQAGGSAAGGIFVGVGNSLTVGNGVTFTGDSGKGGTGGNGGSAFAGSFHGAGGEGGAPGQSGSKGSAGFTTPAAGGAPGMNGAERQDSGGGGGGGGLQDSNFTGFGTIDVPVIVVTSDAASGEGSLSQALLDAQNGTKIEFAAKLKGSTGNTIDLPSTLILDKNVTIEGIGNGGTRITLNAQGKGTAVQVDKGVAVVIDGVTIANGKDISTSTAVVAVGGILDNGDLTVTNTIFKNDTAKGAAGANGSNISTGGFGTAPQGGKAGGSAAGGIFVAKGATVSVSANDVFTGVSAIGGTGGNGGTGLSAKYPAGKGGASGKAGGNGKGAGAGKGGAPGHDGTAAINLYSGASAGGGGGGLAYKNYGGPGTVKQLKTTGAAANTASADSVGVNLFNQFVAAGFVSAAGGLAEAAIFRHLTDATPTELVSHPV